MVRDGDWKLCLCPRSGGIARLGNLPKPEETWHSAVESWGKPPTRDDLKHALFVQLCDLANDPHEDENLAAERPEQVAKIIALLQEQGRLKSDIPWNTNDDCDT